MANKNVQLQFGEGANKDNLYPKTLGTLVMKADGTTQFCEEGAQVNVIEGITVNGTAVTPDTNKKANIVIPSSSLYTIVQVSSPAAQYSAQYYLAKDGVQSGAMINIGKDMVMQSGSCVNITYDSTTQKLYDGADDVTEIIKGTGVTPTASDAGAYLRFIIANSTNDRIYVAVQSLLTQYTAGDGITISNGTISVTYGNGLEMVLGVLKVKTNTALSASANGIDVNYADGLGLTANNQLKVVANGTGGLDVDSNGIKVKINATNPSLECDSNGLKVKTDSDSDIVIGSNGLKLAGESNTSHVCYFSEITIS